MPILRISPAFIASATSDHRPDLCLVQTRLHSPDQADRVLHVPGLPSRDGSTRHTDRTETKRTKELRDTHDHGGVHPRISHETSASDRLGSRFELGFYEQYRLPQRQRGREETLKSYRERDEREVRHK